MDFNSFISNLNQLGFYDFVLPWILFLVIFFVIIEKLPFMTRSSQGDGKKKQISIIIAAILSFFAVNYQVHGIPLGQKLSEFFGWTSIYVAGFLVIMLLLGLVGFDIQNLFGEKGKFILPLVVVLIALLVLGQSGFSMLNISETTMTFVFMAVLLIGAVLFLGEDGDGNTSPGDKPKSG